MYETPASKSASMGEPAGAMAPRALRSNQRPILKTYKKL